MSEVPTDVAAAQSQWEAERAELVKARDEANARIDVSLLILIVV